MSVRSGKMGSQNHQSTKDTMSLKMASQEEKEALQYQQIHHINNSVRSHFVSELLSYGT